MTTYIEDEGFRESIRDSIRMAGALSRTESISFPFSKYVKASKPKLGRMLILRKDVYPRRQRMCDLSLALAIFGIAVMILNIELEFNDIIARGGPVFQALKWVITGSTGVLVMCIYMYHRLDTKLVAINYSMDDWRLAVTQRRVLSFLAECAVCLVHPIPWGEYYIDGWPSLVETERFGQSTMRIPVNHPLSMVMFLRLYLVGRYLVQHSRLSGQASFQSLALLNRIHFDFRFILKSAMVLYPGRFLTVFITSSIFTMTWTAHFCDMQHRIYGHHHGHHDNGTSHHQHRHDHKDVLDSAWMIIITFLTIGYGDVVPGSYCGRIIATLTGILGVASTAFIVAILAQKMEFSRSEAEVHNFVLDIELQKKIKLGAADVIKHGWKLYRMKLTDPRSTTSMIYDRKVLFQQMNLTRAVYRLRNLRDANRRLKDSSVNMAHVSRGLEEVRQGHQVLNERMERIEGKLDHILDVLTLTSKMSRKGLTFGGDTSRSYSQMFFDCNTD